MNPNHLRQLLPKSSEEQDNDILDVDKQPSVSQGESDSSNCRDQNFAPRYSYTFSGSFGGSFDQDDAVPNSSCKSILIKWHLHQEHQRTLVLLFPILLLNILRQNHGTTAVAVDTVILATTLTQGPHLPSITVPEEGKALVVV